MNIQDTVYPSYPEFTKLAQKGNLIPLYREITADLETPVSTFLKVTQGKPYSCLLESVEGGEHWGRYSFISWNPKSQFISKGNLVSNGAPGKAPQWRHSSDPIGELKQLMANYEPVEIKGLPRFWGGAVGYVSYDMVRFFEHLPAKPKEKLDVPDAFLMLTDRMVIFDHLAHTLKIVVCADCSQTKNRKQVYAETVREIESISSLMEKPLKLKKGNHAAPAQLHSNLTAQQFSRNVQRAKRYIKNGDIIQVVLSQRFSRQTAASAFNIYRSLRFINPSPYMYYLSLGEFQVIGSSPEVLVRKEDTQAETRPIAGTKRRGINEDEEKQLMDELLADPKERAEHIMLVDLGRNDLARVCEPASVSVPQLMSVEKYSHVMHIESSVTGTLKPGTDAFDLFRATFPAGTVSGAPKVRAMQIIDELEPEARGPYAGAVGYFSYTGNMDMAIAIRTIVLKDGVAYAQAGAGIVADSKPAAEYQETKNKAAALFAALERAEKSIEL